jgi:hypothetical protein
MADNEKYRQKYIADVSAHIGQPVEAVGIFSRPGSMGSVLTSQFSPLAAMIKNRASAGKAGGLPQNVVIGVTADKVFVFGYKPRGTSLKLKDPIGVFERSGMRAEVVGQGSFATRVRFTLPTGDTIELDSNRMPGSSSDFNAPVVQALAPASA